VLLLERVPESLAGRASYLTLWPMTRREQRGQVRCARWDELLAATDEAWPDELRAGRDEPEAWRAQARRGGFPTPSLELPDEHARAIWFDANVHTYVERDLQALSAITALPDFRRTLRAAALRLARSSTRATSHAELHHWRTADGREVDLVVETAGTLLPIEVKSTVRPRAGDTAGLRSFRAAYPFRTRARLLLHAGDKTE
jgi:predicted AAA+ superfamily ATPase